LKKIVHILPLLVWGFATFAQKSNPPVRKGNEFYKKKDFEAALQEYNKGVLADEKNAIAQYNLGNAQFRTNKLDDALSSYDNSINNSTDKAIRQKSYYNKGVALSKQQKLAESIDAWKEALKLDPTDVAARENLQKALKEQKRQQEQKEKEKKDQKDKKQDQKQQKDQKPKEQESKLNKQQVEQLLKALQQKEKEVQQKLQKANSSSDKPEKDW